MKVEINRKDALAILLNLEYKLRAEGDLAASIAVELGRASIKRVPTLTEIRYVGMDSVYTDVKINTDEESEERVKEA